MSWRRDQVVIGTNETMVGGAGSRGMPNQGTAPRGRLQAGGGVNATSSIEARTPANPRKAALLSGATMRGAS